MTSVLYHVLTFLFTPFWFHPPPINIRHVDTRKQAWKHVYCTCRDSKTLYNLWVCWFIHLCTHRKIVTHVCGRRDLESVGMRLSIDLLFDKHLGWCVYTHSYARKLFIILPLTVTVRDEVDVCLLALVTGLPYWCVFCVRKAVWEACLQYVMDYIVLYVCRLYPLCNVT